MGWMSLGRCGQRPHGRDGPRISIRTGPRAGRQSRAARIVARHTLSLSHYPTGWAALRVCGPLPWPLVPPLTYFTYFLRESRFRPTTELAPKCLNICQNSGRCPLCAFPTYVCRWGGQSWPDSSRGGASESQNRRGAAWPTRAWGRARAWSSHWLLPQRGAVGKRAVARGHHVMNL